MRRHLVLVAIVAITLVGAAPSGRAAIQSETGSGTAGASASAELTTKAFVPFLVKPLPYHFVPDSANCTPNAGVSYYNGMVRDREGNLQNGVCVHIAFFEPRNTKCSGCDGVGNGLWGFAPFGGQPAPADIPVEIFIVSCPAIMPPGGTEFRFRGSDAVVRQVALHDVID
jgi:hypothetical protein